MMLLPQSYATDTTTQSSKEPAPAIDTTKTPPTNVKKITPQNTIRDNGEIPQARPPLQPCEGVPSTITVEPRVQQFLDCKIINILAQPEQVESFTVDFKKDSTLPERNRLGVYPIKEQGRNLTAEEVKDLQKLLFTEKSYIFGIEKRCRFRPEIGLHFVKGNESVEVLFSFACDLWLFIHKDEEKLEDFDPVRQKLDWIHNSLFSDNVPQ